MVIAIEKQFESLGNEPKEVLGFDSDYQLEIALKKLMEEMPDEGFETK